MFVRKHKFYRKQTMADATTIMLATIATVIVLYIIQQEGPRKKRAVDKATPVGMLKKPRAALGRSADCTDVAIDSPDFARCAQTLGTGRSVVRSKPRADRIENSFMKENYKTPGPLGNPFAVKIDDKFTKDTDRRLGAGKAFPFSKSGALPKHTKNRRPLKTDKLFANNHVVEAPARGSSRPSVALGSTVENGMGYNKAFLGAAVSPSASSSLGATPEEIAQATSKLDDINKVASNTGGNLNLLHPL